MSEADPSVPEPTEEDERRALELIRTRDATSLQGEPRDGERCGGCHFSLTGDGDGDGLSYCWHEELRIVVGDDWWCQHWAEPGTVDTEPSEADAREAARLRRDPIEAEQWVPEPHDGERCDDCLFYLAPGDGVSYCWNPELRVLVGADHWCRRWRPAPDTQTDAY